MKNKKFWRLENSVESSGSRLYIDGVISEESWWGDEATPQQLRQELKEAKGDKLEVVINSPGGDVWAGVAMHDALKELDAEVTIKVSGLAASIASVIAMAGDKIVMTPGSTMMIHKASMMAWGNTDDMEKAIAMLKTVEEGIVSIYADRTGQTPEAVNEMMEAETWMSAEKAVELGFADAVVKPAPVEEEETLENQFSGNFAFSMSATKQSMDNFLEKVKETNDVTDTPKATNEVVEQEPAPSIEPTKVKEEPEEVNDKKENEMNEEEKAKAIAQNQVIEPQKQAAPSAQAVAKDYLASNKAVEDYANVLAQNAGKDASVVMAAWKDHLVQNNITNPEKMLPAAVITSIEDAFKQGGQIWDLVDKTGLDVFRVAWDTVEGEDSRAKGHKRGTTKGEEVITLDDRTIRPQFIYKYLTLDKETVRENRSTGALLRYVLSELPKRVVRELERAIVIGDGRANNANYKISSFISLKADTAAGNTFASTYTPEAGASRYESLLLAQDQLLADGARYLIAKKGYLSRLKLEQGVNGGYIFAPGANVADAMGFAGVVEPDWFTDATDADNDGYIFVPSAYKTVGDNTVEAFTNFILKENKNEYLQEIYHGGGLAELKAAVAIAATPAVVEE